MIIPQPDGQSGICAPFGCDTRIQQVFDAALFPSLMRIEALVLYNDVPHSAESFIEPARYEFFLATTRASSATITADFDANRRHAPKVIDFTVSDFLTGFTGGLVLPLSRPFVYNPRAGNLLLEIRKDQTGHFGDGPIYVDGNADAAGVALVTDTLGVQRGIPVRTAELATVEGPLARVSRTGF